MIKRMEKVRWLGQMGQYMMVNIKMIKGMDLENLLILMEVILKENFRMIRRMEKVGWLMKMGIVMKVIMKMIKGMEKER